jgi:REP element-mobilizing transposase RayT
MLIYGNLRNRLEVEASPLPPRGTHPNSLGAILQNFKSVSKRKVNQAAGCSGSKIWQRDYYERIIRDEPELLRIRRFIHDNPLHWEQDQVRPSSL